jgi:antitoxin FitA
MASITIRNLDEQLKSRLRIQAAKHGRSMEEEARDVLRTALARVPTAAPNFLKLVQRRFAKAGPIELSIPPRDPGREPPDFDR